jgi:hypothetical protein
MIIYSGIIFDYHLVNPPLAIFSWMQVPKGKEEEKKERRCVVLGTNSCIFSILYCNILSVHCCNLILFIPKVVIILLFQNFVKTMYNVLMINKAQVFFLY